MQLLLQEKSNKYYIFQKCVFVSLGIQQAMHKLHTVICDLSDSTIFFHIISSMARFLKNKFTENKMCFDCPYNFCLKHFSFQEELTKI